MQFMQFFWGLLTPKLHFMQLLWSTVARKLRFTKSVWRITGREMSFMEFAPVQTALSNYNLCSSED